MHAISQAVLVTKLIALCVVLGIYGKVQIQSALQSVNTDELKLHLIFDGDK